MIKPETKRLKDLVKEWRGHGLSGGYESKAGYLHLRSETLEAAIAEYEHELRVMKVLLDSGKRVDIKAREPLERATNVLQKELEFARTAQSAHPFTRERGWPEYQPGDPHNRALDLARGFDRDVQRAAELKRLGFGATSMDPARARAAVDAATSIPSLPPGTSRG